MASASSGSIALAKHSTRPYASLLFVQFALSPEGQQIIKEMNRIPSSMAVDSPLNKFKHELIDSVMALDEWDKWEALWSRLFLGGKKVQKEE